MQYSAISPRELFAIAQNKIDTALKESLPELEALEHNKKRKKTKVSYYEGLGGLRELNERMFKALEGREMVGFASHKKDIPMELAKFIDEEWYPKIRRIKRPSIRAISPCENSIKKYVSKDFLKKHKIKMKILPKEKYNSHITINTVRSYTQIMSLRYMQGILIDNPDIADVVRQIFNLVWERDDITKLPQK